MSGKAFAFDVRRLVEKAKGDADEVVRGALFDLSGRIIERTPVGDPSLWKNPPPPGYIGGTAKANWRASIGVPDTTVDLNAKGSPLAEVQVVIDKAVGSVFYLSNSVPYINRLEYGAWSTQAPSGMVRVSITEFDQAVNQAAAKL